MLSIEVFPPKTPAGLETLRERIRDYAPYKPDYVSVTYGAGGSTRRDTADLCRFIQEEARITAMAHLTCAGQGRDEIREFLERLKTAGIRNVIGLRGDPPQGETTFKPAPGGFAHADDLIRFLSEGYDFGLACAGYPEGHVEAPSLEQDVDFLKRKLDAGAEFVVTQFFLDNTYFLKFRDLLFKKGIRAPIVAGILPISNYSQISRFSMMCGCTIPAKVMRGLHGRSDADQEKFGLDHAVEQVEGLLRHDVDGIHIYALNKRQAVEALAPLVRAKHPG